MTEELGGGGDREAPEPLEPTPSPEVEGTAPSEDGDFFSSSEGMVSFGAGLILAAYVIFDLIWAEYAVRYLAILFAVLAVALPRVNRSFTDRIAPLAVLMRSLGYLLLIIGVVTLAENLRHAGSVLDGVPEILGALVAYAGFAIAFVGARSIEVD
jgi:uncharacterized membrane protein